MINSPIVIASKTFDMSGKGLPLYGYSNLMEVVVDMINIYLALYTSGWVFEKTNYSENFGCMASTNSTFCEQCLCTKFGARLIDDDLEKVILKIHRRLQRNRQRFCHKLLQLMPS